MDIEFIKTLITIIVGALFGGFVNHFFTRRKNEAEIEKLKAETDILRNQLKSQASQTSIRDAISDNEIVLYDGRRNFRSYDITSESSDYEILQGLIVMQSEDWKTLKLRTYFYDGKEYDFIPKNESISGYRKFHISCEFKVIGAAYDVAAYLWQSPEPKDDTDPSIDDRRVAVTSAEWTRIDFNFKAPPNKNYTVNISVERRSGDGSVQIRNLVVAERIS